MIFQMNIIRPVRGNTGYPTCVMTSMTSAAVYSFPTEQFPMCLVLFSPVHQIYALQDLLGIVDELEQAEELQFRLQIFGKRVEVHFDTLNTFATELILTFISSVKHFELGDWAFLPSGAGQVL